MDNNWKQCLVEKLTKLNSTRDSIQVNCFSLMQVGICQDHNVFKSGHQNLRTHFLGESPTSSSDFGFEPVLLGKRKLEVRFEAGGSGEKILAAYQAACEEHIDEDIILKAYESSAKRVKEIENDVCNGCETGRYLDITQSIQLSDELIQEETVLWECTNQLRSNEKATAAVLSQLREAIQQEEYKLETIRDQLKDAEDEAENARRIRRMSLQNISDGSHRIYSQNSTVANTERTQVPTTSMGHKIGAGEVNIGAEYINSENED